MCVSLIIMLSLYGICIMVLAILNNMYASSHVHMYVLWLYVRMYVLAYVRFVYVCTLMCMHVHYIRKLQGTSTWR